MKLTNAEWQIRKVLWDEYPATARQISTRLPRNIEWAYTTIKTMLTRLADKKVVHERKQGNTSLYEPILTRRKAQRGALHNLANQAFDGAFGPLMHFLIEERSLSAEQRETLIRALETSLKEKHE